MAATEHRTKPAICQGGNDSQQTVLLTVDRLNNHWHQPPLFKSEASINSMMMM